ncbi:MAG: hypothetical protein JWM67_1546 [Mycobacterium sp.]|nr:hypothetical protein [Mycobacterium sp.]
MPPESSDDTLTTPEPREPGPGEPVAAPQAAASAATEPGEGPAAASDAAADEAAAQGASPGRRHAILLTVVACVVALALVAALIVVGIYAHTARSKIEARNDALSAARQVAIDLTSFQAASVDQQLNHLLTELTGNAKTQLTNSRNALTQSYTAEQLTTVSHIRAAGTATTGLRTAVVIVALDTDYSVASGPLSNPPATCVAGGGKLSCPQRIRLTLQRSGQVWRVSDIASVA